MNPPSGSSASDAPPAAEGHALGKPAAILDFENLKPGGRWRGLYQIGEQLTDVTFGRVFKAQHVGTMLDVLVRVFKVRDDVRARTWESLKRAQNGELLELVDAVESEGRRIEVVEAGPAMNLRELAGRKKVTPVETALIVKQLADTVGCLHRHGVVHLNLRPDTIYVRATEGGIRVIVGGFEKAQLLAGVEGPVEVSMDPFYAPPEAVGVFQYPRDSSLRAWDWWSFGRVIQELILGQHVLGHMLERDVSRETPELRSRAENLLKEENQMVRAGAVEIMPSLDKETNTLLRGLLTASRDGRWGLAEVEAWLRKEPVKERYNLPKNERLFIWRDRAYTVAEAAEYFSRAPHWPDGLENLFETTNVATLAYFLSQEGSHKKTKERFESMLKLVETPALQQLPEELIRDVVASLIFKFLAGHQAPLVLRGQRVDENFLREMLSPSAQPAGLGLVFGFTARPIVQQIEQLDAETGRMLGEIERTYEVAIATAEKHRWLPENDAVQMAGLILFCMEPEPALNAGRAEMQKLYACTRDHLLDLLFKKPDAGHAELAIIAFTHREPKKYGYVTHREWNEEQYRKLKKHGEDLSSAGTWLRLGQALRLGPIVFGRFRYILPLWLSLSAGLAFVWQNIPAFLLAGLFPPVAFFLRLSWHGVHKEKLKDHVHEGRPWKLRSGCWHCRNEALLILHASTVPGPKEVLRLLHETNEQIGKIKLDPAPKPVAFPLRFKDTLAVSLVSWVVTLVLVSGTCFQAVRHPPKMPDIDFSVITRLFSSSDHETNKPRLSLEQTAVGNMKSMQSLLEDLRRAKKEAGARDVKMSWPFKTPTEAQPVRILESSPALPEQAAIAEELGGLLVDRYNPETIKDLVAVQVPVEKGFGLMLFNGKTGKLAGRKVYVIGFLPMARAWLDLDSNKAVFLNGQ